MHHSGHAGPERLNTLAQQTTKPSDHDSACHNCLTGQVKKPKKTPKTKHYQIKSIIKAHKTKQK